MEYFRSITAKYIAPASIRGARVKITDNYTDDITYIAHNQLGTRDAARKYLEDKGIKIVAYTCTTEKGFVFLTLDFKTAIK